MTHRLNRKIALVTAAGQGIGRAISEAFIAEGATVIATDLDPGKLEGLAAARRDKLDVRSAAAVDAFAQQVMQAYGAPDILVNCAGFVHHGTVLDCSEADWTFSFDLNVTSIHRMLRAFLPGMVEKRRDHQGRCGASGLHRPPADGAARHRARGRGAGGVPGVR